MTGESTNFPKQPGEISPAADKNFLEGVGGAVIKCCDLEQSTHSARTGVY